jgi:hypothetical protein
MEIPSDEFAAGDSKKAKVVPTGRLLTQTRRQGNKIIINDINKRAISVCCAVIMRICGGISDEQTKASHADSCP